MIQTKKLLIVDDNKVNRRVLCKILSDTYEVLEAENGKEAMAVLYNSYESISAVLLDIIMPVMNGYEVLEEIQKDTLLSKIPIIVTTGNDDRGAEEKALSLGAHDFLVKPYRPAVILHRLANTIKLRETAALVNAVEKDELTGVYSKEFFYKKAEKKLRENGNLKYDIVCMDIERFKLVNDLFSMQSGDELLKHIANVVMHHVGDHGICGRVGADEFACLIQHREHYEDDFFKSAIEAINEFPINISINVCYGIYCIDDVAVPISVMCDRALIACNSIKGKYDIHHAFYSDKLRQSLLFEQVILDSMKTALVENQFEIYYQPKYDLSNETIAGAEALVRWNHPDKGFISPADFIPLFERNGFITNLDIYVWENVCRQLRHWLDNGYPIMPISVNVSRADIYNPKLTQILTGLIKKYNLNPEYLHIEITETAYTDNPDQIINTVLELRNLGFIIEMDDFGTGYSSLNMLSELPIHVLKLDMKFIQSETAKRNRKNILSFIISLAKWLNLKVVAEGVETEQQVQALKSMDCNYAQGYYYARPMPHDDFKNYLKQYISEQTSETEATNKSSRDKISIQKSKSDRVMVIVDDSALNRTILSKIFHELYTIVEAENGQDAYLYLEENFSIVDIVLLDLVMPVMDGFQMLERMKNCEQLRNIPVIITTQTGEDSETRAFAMGAADFIPKPYNRKVALHRVNNVMAQSKLRAIERERELAREVEKMRYKAEHDSLTGLYNRAALETEINNYFANHETAEGTLLMLDIDCFKSVNDTFGHAKGDDLLVEISNILLSSFREEDVVARLGGDEFAVFIPFCLPLADLQKRAKNLCERLQIQLDGIKISATIGIANVPRHGSDYQTLYKNADSALLAAKRLGKNQYKIFDDQMEMPTPALYRNMDWLLDETSDAIVICDMKSYEILYLNSVAAKIAGKDKSLCIGQTCYKTLWKRERPCEHCISCSKLSKVYIEQEVEDDATKHHYIIRDKLMEWGNKYARIQYIQDDTERNQFRKGLMQANERFSSMLSSLQAGLVKCLLNDQWTVLEANDKFYEIIGYSKEEFEDRFDNSLVAVIDPRYLEENRIQLKQQLKIGKRVVMDSCFINCQGKPVYVIDQTIVVTEQDGKTYFYCTYIRKADIQILQKGGAAI
ncbi:Cyclic di-GMP phosphodiesterase Gmr [Eubacterium limosum]|uniref:Stage 0 sporulation protein A homolog n=1 Tax=Eubacterium limosum TaxID=1736 RepID=A0A6N3H8F6_EUBLI